MSHEGPTCPNCSRPMQMSRTVQTAPIEADEVHVFQCRFCNISFITEDHLPIAGERVH